MVETAGLAAYCQGDRHVFPFSLALPAIPGAKFRQSLLAVVRKAARDCILRLNWAPDYSDSTEAYPAAMNRPSDRNVGIPIPTTLPYGLGVSGRGEAELSS